MAHAHKTQAKISLLKKTLFAGRNATPASFGGRRGGKCAILALLFCVCGAMSAWGQATYYWNPDKTPQGDFNDNTRWKIFSGSSYSDANDIPKPGDSAVFGKSQNVPDGLELQDIDYNVRLQLQADAEITNLYVCFSSTAQSKGSVSFSNVPNGNLSTKMVTDNFIIYNDNSNTKKTIFLNTQLTVGSNITIPSGITVTVGTGYNTTINGTVTIESGATLVVNGTLTLNGTITNNGAFENNSTGTFNLNAGTFANNATGTFTNNGTVNITSGDFTYATGGTINENGKWVYNATGVRDLVIPYGPVDEDPDDLGTVINDFFYYKDVEIANGEVIVPAGKAAGVRSGSFIIKSGAAFTIKGSFLPHNQPSRVPFTIEQNATFRIDGTKAMFRAAGNITNNGNIYLTNGLLDRNYISSEFTNNGTITVDSGADYRTNNGNFTENGTWIYVSNRTQLFAVKNDNIQSYNNLQIGDGNTSPKVTLSADVTATGKLTVEAGAAFDLASRDLSAATIENNGTVRLHGTQTVSTAPANITNATGSTVEFYNNTGNTAIDISKMGTTFATLKCDTSAGNDRKVLDFSNVTDVAMLNLNSNATNPLVIQGTAVTQIAVAGTARGSGNNLRVDYKNVQLTGAGTPYALTNSLGRDTATGTVEGKTTGIRNGWNFGGVAEYYFWTSGNDNWNEVGKWEQADDPDPLKSPRIPAERYPGQTPTPTGFGGYHVYIEPAAAATVTLNVTPLNLLSSLTLGNNGTLNLNENLTVANTINIGATAILALGEKTLTANGTWANSGTVTVGNAGTSIFGRAATDNGTWTYNNTADRSLINLTYNDLNLNGTGIITPIADVSATGTIRISGATTFDLASRDLSAATIENNGTVRLHGTQNVSTTNISNATGSTVEFYNNTGNTAIDVSKMGTSYGDLIVNGYNKTLAFPANTNVAGNLILKGANDNASLTITTNATSATINVATSQQSNEGQYLRIDRAKVTIISGSPFGNPTCSYYAKNSYDTEETTDAALLPVRNGWKIDIPIHLTNMLLSVAPIGGNTVYVRAVQTTMDGLSSVPSGLITNMLKRFFKIYESTGTSPAAGITVTNASLVRNSSKVTWIRLSLSGLGGITVADLQKYYVRTYTNDPSAVSTEGFHPISDFAVGAVNPLFAYDNRYADSDANWQSSAVSSGVAVRNWDSDQGNTGSLLSKKDIVMSVRVASGVGTPVLHLSSNPTSGSQSGKYNGDTNSNWRIWLPDVTGLAALAGNTNTNTIDTTTGSINVTGGGTNPIFNIPASNNSSYSSWKDGDQITFMFELKDTSGASINVGGSRGTANHPLYALRLRNAGDINSLDLWSFRLRSMTAQRGGVSIRNNVINIATGEQVAIEVDMPKSGTLNVMIMTLDGSIVKYLQHGTTSAGKHVYHWGGLTNSSSPVARGLYFIRIVGSGIDETRKVMVVK